MASPLLIVMEGGLIQSIHTNDPDWNVPIVIIDYDTEGADPEDLTPVPQDDDGTTVEAWVVESSTYGMSPHIEEFLWDFLEGHIQ